MARNGSGGVGYMRGLTAALLMTTAIVLPVRAEAEPVTAFVAGLGFTSATTAAVAAALYPTIYAVGSFLGTTLLGSILLQVGTTYLITELATGGGRNRDLEEVQINSRIEAPERFQLGGPVAVGGTAGIFGEFDEDRNFWYIVAHGDAELTNTPSYILDGLPVTLSDGTDGFTAGDVITDEFCLDDKGNSYEGGTRVPQFRIYTVTPSVGNLYGALPSDFTTAFTSLPADFFLAGVCYSIIRIKTVKLEDRFKVYKWRGPIGLGEPSVVMFGNFSRMYDPREPSHDVNDRDTWTASTGNSAIVWAWWRTNPFGRNRDVSEIDWDRVAAAADICDETVLDREGVATPRYRCGIAAKDSSTRGEIEREILKTCDGFAAYSDEGKAYPVVGKYEAPTLTFTGDRDIIAPRTEIVDDGETPVDGVVVRYISPDHGYTKQDCSPWVNPEYYVAGREPVYAYVDVLACQNHNQAFRLAGALGPRLAASKRAALGCTIKGILAKNERAINLELDSDFTGVFEIATPVEEGADGMATAFAVVPLSPDRWDGAGQAEGEPPAIAPDLEIDDSLEVAQGVNVYAREVSTDNGKAVRLEAIFDAPSIGDRLFQFRYTETGGAEYEYFTVDMDELRAYSAIVEDGVVYDVQWQTITGTGRASGWAADVGGGETVYTITATANSTPPSDLVSAAAYDGVGETAADWTAANDANQYAVEVYRGTTTTFGDATKIDTVVTGPNQYGSYYESGIATGTYYYWMIPINGSGIQGNTSGPYTSVVT